MTPRSETLGGKRVLITGAGSGIGRAIAIGYARAGAVVACVSRTHSALEETARLAEEAGGRAIVLQADVCDAQAMQAQVRAAAAQLGGLDIVIAAAGAPSSNRPVETTEADDFRRTLEVNLVGAFNTARAVIPELRRSGGGQMVFVGSGMGHRASATRSAYACSKAGLNMLVRVLAQELADDGIAVNELVPGPVMTAFITGRVEQLRKASSTQGSAAEWFKEADDVVPMALFLATQPQPGPTGQTFSLARREL